MPELEQSQGSNMFSLRALRLRYLLALGLVAALTMAGQALFQYDLRDNEGYARTINLAGRQRMLAAAMTRSALGLLAEAEPALREQSLGDLGRDLGAWRAMNGHLEGSPPPAGLKPGGPEIRQAWQELDPLITGLGQSAERLLAAARQGRAPAELRGLAGELLGLGRRYLPAMDRLVRLYAEEARSRSRSLQTLGLSLAGLVLLLLVLEGLFIFRPITRRVRSDMFRLTALAEEMRELSLKDGLTGIFNRRHFDEQLTREWRRGAREDHLLSLLLLDIDHFKAFNDHYGHQAGDQALQSVASAAGRELRRPGDLLARYGGEELAMILPRTGLEGALLLAENIRRAVAELGIPNRGAPSGPVLTASLGVAVARPARHEGPESLVAAADQALYRAKQAGRNRVAGPAGSAPEEWS